MAPASRRYKPRPSSRAGDQPGSATPDESIDSPPRKRDSVVRRTRRIPLLSAVTLVVGLLVSATPAQATFPGSRGKIAFSTDIGDNPQVFTVESDGSDQRQVTRDADGHAFAPDWSPDGTKIAFEGDATGNHEIYLMNSNGSGRTQLTNDPD